VSFYLDELSKMSKMSREVEQNEQRDWAVSDFSSRHYGDMRNKRQIDSDRSRLRSVVKRYRLR